MTAHDDGSASYFQSTGTLKSYSNSSGLDAGHSLSFWYIVELYVGFLSPTSLSVYAEERPINKDNLYIFIF